MTKGVLSTLLFTIKTHTGFRNCFCGIFDSTSCFQIVDHLTVPHHFMAEIVE